MSLRDAIIERIRTQGPLSFAEYMNLALYHPELGYYARADQRSGRAGDFLTSVDIGTLFGELLAEQFAEMWRLTVSKDGTRRSPFALVEAGAGNGRLARDVLDKVSATDPDFYDAVRLTLVESSPAGRAAQAAMLGSHVAKLDDSGTELPDRIRGIIYANELLDALPVHPVAMTDEGLRELYVDADDDQLVERLGPPSAAVRRHVERFGIQLEPGWRAEVSPAAVRWVEEAGRRLECGFLLLIDYGHEANELYSLTHATGTLTCYRRHRAETGAGTRAAARPWLEEPGARDITAHVDLTAIQTAADEVGLHRVGVLDQTYFLLGLASRADEPFGQPNDMNAIKRRLALKTLLLPGGLGSTHKVLIFSKNVGTPELRGCSFSHRVT